MREYCDKQWMLQELERQKASGSVNPKQIIEEAPTVDMSSLLYWIETDMMLPPDEEKVLCFTMTKSGVPNIVVGYYSPELGRWCCGMNSNVVAWRALPSPELLAATYEEIQKRHRG